MFRTLVPFFSEVRVFAEVMRFVPGVALVVALGLSGCGKTPAPDPAPGNAPTGASTATKAPDDEHGHSHAGHSHDGWWCPEHGVPEDQCGLCDSKLAAEFKRKGDWCKEHDRPDSQCFECHPELEARFAALYEAKYGTKPPARPDQAEQ